MRVNEHVRFGEGGTGDPATGDRPLLYREAEYWYAVFTCEIGKPEALPVSYEDVGIDLGVTHFGALSNGDFIDNARYLRKAEKKLKKLQAALSRKKRGSHRRNKAVQAVSKAHRKIRNQRR